MGLIDSAKAFFSSVDTEYERRVRSASNVREYKVGGHGPHDSHDGHTHLNEVERLEGEGGAVGSLQANAGPQLHESQGADRHE